MTTRNQFVWVPVPDTSKMFTTYNGKDVGQLYDFNTSAKSYSKIALSSSGYREPDVVTSYDNTASNYSSAGITGITNATQFLEQLETEFGEMKASVERYHGFYIGRYETGAGSIVAKGRSPLVNETWYQLYQDNKDMVNLSGVKSSMIWGCQWDRTLIWFHTQGEENAESVAKKNYVYDARGKCYRF